MESGTRRGVLARGMAMVAAAAGAAFATKTAHAETAPSVASLQAQLAEVTARLAALEAWRATAGVFTLDASGAWTFAPEKGDVAIAAPGALALAGHGRVELTAGGGSNAVARVTSEGSYEVHAVKRAFPG